MGNIASLESPERNRKTETVPQRLWRWFIEPSSKITELDQRRQAALLSAFLLGLSLIALVVQFAYTFLAGQPGYSAYSENLTTVLVLLGIYGLSRMKYVQLTANIAVICTSIALFLTCWAHPDGVPGGLFDYLIVPIWLASFYMSIPRLVWVVGVELIGLLIFPLFAPVVTLDIILVGPFSFVLTASAILIIMTRHRNLLEQDRRAELIEKEHQTQREADRAKALLRVADRLNAELELDALQKALSEEVAQALNTPVSIVILYDPKQNILYPTAGAGLSLDLIKGISPLPRNIYDLTVKQLGKVFAIQDLQSIPGLSYLNEFKRLNLRSIAFATMEYAHQLIGSLNAVTVGESRRFTEDELLLLHGIADQAAVAITNTRLYKDARRRLDNLQALRAIDIAISSNHNLQETLNVVLDQITQQLQVDAAVILLLDETRQQLEFGTSRGFHTSTLRYTSLRVGEGMAGRAAQQRQIVHVRDLGTDPQSLVNASALAQEGFVSYYAAPLLSQGKVKGVLEIFHRSLLDPDNEWLTFLETLVGQAAIAIESTTLFADLQRTNDELLQAYDSTIEGWSRALDLRDKETEGHTQRVTELTLELARAFGFSDSELIYVRWGALLHDIGKMGVPDRILLKEGPLTEEEWVAMRRHPVYAHEMLRPIQYLRPALDIPYCHHEKWDGTGYPRGLKREQIPLVARLFAVIDVWDALTSDRPYRAAWPREKTLAHIRAAAGKHFDPQVVEVFVGLIK